MRRWIGAILGLACAPAALADFDAASYPPYETCALCHGLFGQSRLDKFPHLAGQKPAYIQAQLDAFLGGERSNDGGQMSSIVTELKPEDFAVVVAWFSEQDPPAASNPPEDSIGMDLVEASNCLGCHTDDPDNAIPYLTSQHAGYLAKQMHDFREGRRTHSDAAALHQDYFTQMEDGIDAVAAYLASLERSP